MIDEAPGAASPRLDADAHLTDVINDVGDRQEVRLETEAPHGGEFVVQPIANADEFSPAGVRISINDSRFAPLAEHSYRIGSSEADRL